MAEKLIFPSLKELFWISKRSKEGRPKCRWERTRGIKIRKMAYYVIFIQFLSMRHTLEENSHFKGFFDAKLPSTWVGSVHVSLLTTVFLLNWKKAFTHTTFSYQLKLMCSEELFLSIFSLSSFLASNPSLINKMIIISEKSLSYGLSCI